MAAETDPPLWASPQGRGIPPVLQHWGPTQETHHVFQWGHQAEEGRTLTREWGGLVQTGSNRLYDLGNLRVLLPKALLPRASGLTAIG